MNSYLLDEQGNILSEYIDKTIDGWFHSEERIDSTCNKIVNNEIVYLPLKNRGKLDSNNILVDIYSTRKDDGNHEVPDGIIIGYKYENNEFVLTPELFNILKQNKINEINNAAENEIVSGIFSDALGEMHRYDSDIVDQINFSQAMEMSRGYYELWLEAKKTDENAIETPIPYRIWNTDNITKGWVPHTFQQFKSVLQDGANLKAQILYKCSLLKNQAEMATSLEQLNNINW